MTKRFLRSGASKAHGVDRQQVIQAYKLLLGREPESEYAIAHHQHAVSFYDLVVDITSTEEFLERTIKSPFCHYNSAIDAKNIIRHHARAGLQPTEGVLTNFLGVVISPRYLPDILKGREGQVEGVPIPANWHADIAEWAAALRAVDLANNTFRMAELGCGWGCWMNNAGVAARNAGLETHVIGVEGDEGHVRFAEEACTANGFRPDQFTIWRGIAAPSDGVALFPKQNVSGVEYGLEPVFNASEEQRREALKSGKFDELEMIGLDQVIGEDQRLDLLHIDIQGGEADLNSCFPGIAEAPRCLHLDWYSLKGD